MGKRQNKIVRRKSRHEQQNEKNTPKSKCTSDREGQKY